MIRINLLPKDAIQTTELQPKVMAAIIGAIAFVVLLSAYISYQYALLHNAEQELDVINAEIKAWQPYINKNKKLVNQVAAAKDEYSEVSALDSENTPFWALMIHLSELVDKDTWISKFSAGADGSVSVEGSSLSYVSVSQTLNLFEQDPALKNVKLTAAYSFKLSDEEGSYGVNFVISAMLDRRVDIDGLPVQ